MRRTIIKLKNRGKELSDKKIREIGHKHFAEDFPNPERRGCPPTSEIKLLADKPLEEKTRFSITSDSASRVTGTLAIFSMPEGRSFGPGQAETFDPVVFGTVCSTHNPTHNTQCLVRF